MITLHHLENSRSIRIIWVLEELSVKYDLKTYKRLPSGLAPPELKQVDKLGHAPILEDEDEGKPVKIAESAAIIEYLVHKYGQGKYTSPHDTFWKHYIEGSLMSFCVFKLVLSISIEKVPALLRPVLALVPRMILSQWVEPNLNNAISVVEEQLKDMQGWMVDGDEHGNPTISDFMLAFTVDVLVYGGRADSIGPGLTAYGKRLQEHDSYKRAIEKAGDYRYKK